VKPFAAVLLILALVFGLAFAFRSGGGGHPTQAEMEADLICLTCHAPLDESDSPLAQQMKVKIRQQIAEGWSKNQIEHYFVVTEGFGDAVLAVPPSSGFDLLAWLLPFATIVCGAAAVGVGARAWLRNREDGEDEEAAAGGPPLEPGLELRVDQELARFDG
jgi:cytochrome c-type biogenesis protein CcmH/NrfF